MHSDYATARKIAILILTPIPWSARVPLDPLFAIEVSFIHAVQADGGVGCEPGGPPHNQCRLWGCWEKYVTLGRIACPTRHAFSWGFAGRRPSPTDDTSQSSAPPTLIGRSEEHTSELQSRQYL